MESQSLAIDVVQALLIEGLAEVGDLGESGFEAWQLGSRESLERIRETCRQLGKGPDLSYSCWFGNTEKGDMLAHSPD